MTTDLPTISLSASSLRPTGRLRYRFGATSFVAIAVATLAVVSTGYQVLARSKVTDQKAAAQVDPDGLEDNKQADPPQPAEDPEVVANSVPMMFRTSPPKPAEIAEPFETDTSVTDASGLQGDIDEMLAEVLQAEEASDSDSRRTRQMPG